MLSAKICNHPSGKFYCEIVWELVCVYFTVYLGLYGNYCLTEQPPGKIKVSGGCVFDVISRQNSLLMSMQAHVGSSEYWALEKEFYRSSLFLATAIQLKLQSPFHTCQAVLCFWDIPSICPPSSIAAAWL